MSFNLYLDSRPSLSIDPQIQLFGAFTKDSMVSSLAVGI
jgi:hypothetical protein